MCGILGIATRNKDSRKISERFSKSLNTLHHRGPDNSDIWVSKNKNVFLGHKRLSIIDISEKGNQPFSYRDKYIITFNGEIYNYAELAEILKKKGYKFKTNSDTEILLLSFVQWGINCLDYIDGMFAFAIYDLINNKLFSARDRAGEKPFFYSLRGETLLFASEIKAILSFNLIPREINNKALNRFLYLGYNPNEDCMLKNIFKLPPGNFLLYDIENNLLKIEKYWQLPQSIENKNKNNIEIIEELDQLLISSIKQQLKADVPIGILLSGGLDSSLITAIASQFKENFKTFNISFPNSKKYNEARYASYISKQFNTEHYEFEANNSSASMIPNFVYHFDEPIADTSIFPTWLVFKEVSKVCKVAIGGDGADEIFGGYSHYSRLLKLKKISRFIPLSLRIKISELATNNLDIGIKGRNYLRILGTDFNNDIPKINIFFDEEYRERLGHFLKKNYLVNTKEKEDEISKDFINTILKDDFYNYLPENILAKVDRTSMQNSVEARSPFLNYKLIEYVFKNIPSNKKISHKGRKIILRSLAKKYLPKDFNYSRKQGFSIPLNEWLKKGDFRDFFYESLLGSDTIFNKKSINTLFKLQDKGYSNADRLFSLVILQEWTKAFKVSL